MTKDKVLEINALEALPYEDPSLDEITQQKGGDAQKDSSNVMNSSLKSMSYQKKIWLKLRLRKRKSMNLARIQLKS